MSFYTFQYFRIRQGIERRFRVWTAHLRSVKYKRRGLKIGKGCTFGKDISIIYGWRTRIGEYCIVDDYVQFKCPINHTQDKEPNIVIANNVFIGRGTIIDSNESIFIGDNTFIAPFCFITDNAHNYKEKNVLIRDQGWTTEKVHIGKDVWLGTHVVVLAGVTIGAGSIVAANSTVTKNVPAGVVVGGSPARFIKYR